MCYRKVLLIFSLCLLSACAPIVTHTAISQESESTIESPIEKEPEKGIASWYGPGFAGRQTANGERFDPSEFTAAHPSLAFDTVVELCLLETGHCTQARINDRGPYITGHIIDVSQAVAEELDMIERGIAEVSVEIISQP